MSLFSKLFGKKSDAPKATHVEEYKGFQILPDLMPEGRDYRLAARIQKEIGGELKTHQLIRADTIAGEEAVIAASIAKAKQMIDEQGERIFF